MLSACWSRVSGLLLLLLLASTSVPVAGQLPTSAAEPEILYVSLPAADMPHLPGSPASASSLESTAALEAAIRQRLAYQPPAGSPPPAPTAGGYVTFIVGPDGQVRQAQALSNLGPSFDQALLAAVRKLPRFVPGRLAGKPVAVYRALNVGYQAPFALSAGQPLSFPGTSEWPIFSQQLTRLPQLPGGQRVDEALLRRLVPLPAGAPPPEERFWFTVTAEGRVGRVLFFTSAGERYERAVLQALQALPRFEPGQLNGQPVAALLSQLLTLPQNDPDPTPTTLPPVDSTRVYTYVEQMPALPSGRGAAAPATVQAFVQAHLAIPAEVTRGQVDGRVEVSFSVGPSGVVRQVQLLRPLSSACDAAALAAVARLPRLVPGRQNGQLVTVSLRVTLPFYGPQHIFREMEVARPATFPGGLAAQTQYVQQHLRPPAVLAREQLQGYVQVTFVVGADGQPADPRVTKALCTSCDQEALRLVRAMPRWQPAQDAQGRAVATYQSITLAMPPATQPAGR